MSETKEREMPVIVQDYRSYTAEEILNGILDFAERSGWTDPANLGHWLGAAQRWKGSGGGGWISVKDRLPEPHTRVLLASTRTEMIEAGYYMPDCSCETKWHGIGSVPTHWQPLPEPPND